MTLRALYIDFNSYFASVEQQDRPELRGRPVAVLPVMTDTTCCIATSYEAKRFGVKTGTNVGEAKRLCPDLVCVHARHELYVEYHHALLKAIDTCIPVDEVRSIDEVACSLTGTWQQRDKATGIARQVKKVIRQSAGECMTSSIGIAPNTFLAKTAADMQKPDGLVVIEEEALPEVLHELKLNDFCGIGPRMEARLRRAGIATVEALCAAGKPELRRVWGGIEGEHMYDLLRGLEVYAAPTERGSVGHSHVLPPELRTDKDARAVLHRLLQKAAMRLRKMGYCAGGMWLSVRYVGAGSWGEEARFLETQDTLELTHVLNELWARRTRSRAKPMYVGVTLVRLIPAIESTPSLFAPVRSRSTLQNTMDRINLRYGKHALYFGGAHGGHDASPLRIAFNRIPDVETER
jgi:DNA polymerase IV